MAFQNPFTIDEENNEIRGGFKGVVTLADVNCILTDATIDSIRECDCNNTVRGMRVVNDDKWQVYHCQNCNGVYAHHDLRADYL